AWWPLDGVPPGSTSEQRRSGHAGDEPHTSSVTPTMTPPPDAASPPRGGVPAASSDAATPVDAPRAPAGVHATDAAPALRRRTPRTPARLAPGAARDRVADAPTVAGASPSQPEPSAMPLPMPHPAAAPREPLP